MDNIFLQISVLLGLTVSIAFVIRLMRQPLLVAYVIAGIVAGPFFLDLMKGDQNLYDAFAQFGVVLLLFVVGLSLNLNHLKKIGKTVLVAGLAQFIITGLAGFFILRYIGFSAISSMYIAIAITFSSTIIIVKLLTDKKDTNSVYGRHVIGLMVVQDLIAIFFMLAINSTGQNIETSYVFAQFGLKLLALSAFVFLLSKYLLSKVLDRIAGSSEFLFIFTIAWCFGISSLLYLLGFSVEIGALIAGLSLGSSTYQQEICSRIRPLRDFFIIIFFVILGSEMRLADLSGVWKPALALSAFVVIGGTIILYFVFRILKFTRRNSFLAGVSASQVSEFGFIVLFVGASSGRLQGTELALFTIVALITIFISSYLITYNEILYKFLMPIFSLFGKDKHQQSEEQEKKYDVFVFGYHRIGWKVCESLQEKKIKFAVVDFEPQAIHRLHSRGIPAYFGDAADVEFLSTLNIDKAKLIISTLPEVDDQITMIKYVKSKTKKAKIIANLYHNRFLDDLYKAGADYVMMPHLLGGHWISDVVKKKAWTGKTFESLRKEQKKEMKLRFAHGG
jgi:Kef-type K+ transport system membrane component KefB